MKILATNGLAPAALEKLKAAGFEVNTTKVAAEQLATYINKNSISILLVENEVVNKDLIDHCPGLKFIGSTEASTNIAISYAQKKGVKIIETKNVTAQASAELTFAHLFSGTRFLYDANRNMPLDGDSKFNNLKKSYTHGVELQGKTIGVLGFDLEGKAVAALALRLGMQVLYFDEKEPTAEITISFFDGQSLTSSLKCSPKEMVLKQSHFISVHQNEKQNQTISTKEFFAMKDGVGIINVAKGGLIDEVALVAALESGKVSFAGLDVFESEPSPEITILMHPNISLSPNIAKCTVEAYERGCTSLAEQIISQTTA